LPEGKRVKKGELVVVFDADDLNKLYGEQKVKWEQAKGKAETAKEEMDINVNKADEEVDKAVRALQLAKLDLEKYIHPEGEYTADLAEKQGALELAKKELKEAEEKLVQFRKSVKKGLFPAEQLRLKEAEFEQKQYAVKRDDAKLTVVIKFTKQRQITELQGKVDDAKKALERAESSKRATIRKGVSDVKAAENTALLEKVTLDRLQKQLDKCQVKSPDDGILVYSRDRWWDDSSRIQAGATVFYQQGLFSLPDLEHMQTKVKIHEALVKKVKPGMKAEIRIDAYAGHVLHGTVQSVATLASQEGWVDRFTKEYQTIVVVNDLPLDAGLKPGFTGETKIFVNEVPSVLIVPVQAVGLKEREHFCYVVGPHGIEARAIKVGENNDRFVEIKEGLEEGERVVLDARARIAAEMKAEGGKPEEPAKPVSPAASTSATPQ
jgi:RND family efflux transporter MFP subunit